MDSLPKFLQVDVKWFYRGEGEQVGGDDPREVLLSDHTDSGIGPMSVLLKRQKVAFFETRPKFNDVRVAYEVSTFS
jgi:hypothetical protein